MKYAATLCLLLAAPMLLCAQAIATIAGTGAPGFMGDGGQATAALLSQPSDVFKDRQGNIYIADNGNNRIRVINTAGIIRTIAGNGIAAYSGDGGPAVFAALNHPNRIVTDDAGNVYIADEGNNVIRRIDASGIISTVAGNGQAGFSGDGGAATAAALNDPSGIAADHAGNLYVSDRGNARIRKINAAGVISTYAGGGAAHYNTDGVAATSVSLCGQNYVAVDDAGAVYITNHDCWHFLKISTDGLLYNVAGNSSASYSGDGGTAAQANIEGPAGICPDNYGNVYLSAQQNVRIRKVDASGNIITIAGTGTPGYSGDGGPAAKAQVSETIYGLFADATGVYFADMGNNRVRYVADASIINRPGITVNVYPNPTQNELIISSTATIHTVRLITMLGQVVYSGTFSANQVSIDVSTLASAMYFVNVNDNDVAKFVKE